MEKEVIAKKASIEQIYTPPLYHYLLQQIHAISGNTSAGFFPML